MNEALARAVDAVVEERPGAFHAAFASVAALVPHYQLDTVADRIVDDIPATIPWEVAADLLGMLMWTTMDNGASIVRAAEQWLNAAVDLRRVQIALSLDVYPFKNNQAMQHVLANVARRFPDLAQQCDRCVAERAQSGA